MANKLAAVWRPFSRRPTGPDATSASERPVAEETAVAAALAASQAASDRKSSSAAGATLRRDYGAAMIAATHLVARLTDPDQTAQELVDFLALMLGARRVVLWPAGRDAQEVPAPIAASGDTDAGIDPALWHWALGAVVTPAADAAQSKTATVRLAYAATAGGVHRGVLAIVTENPSGDAERAFAAACATLAGLVLERRRVTAPGESAAESASTEPANVEEPYAGLPTCADMLERIDAEIARGRRFSHPFGLLLLAPDRLIDYRRAHGVAAVDAFRRHLVAQVRADTREVDTLGIGADEDTLLLLLPMMDSDAVEQLGNRLQQVIAQSDSTSLPRPLPTVSGGAASYPDDGTTAAELLTATEGLIAYARRMGGGKIRMRAVRDLDLGSVSGTANPSDGYGDQISEAYRTLIVALSTAGDIHDQARRGHGLAVGAHARALALAHGLSPQQAETIELAGTLHDVGKIGLPEEIVGKQGPLNDNERALLRDRLPITKLLLAQMPAFEATIPLIAGSRERFDSTEPPPLGARIIAIAEAYDAMTSVRPYRPQLTPEAALQELRYQAGGRFDPDLVEAFVDLISALPQGDAPPATTFLGTGGPDGTIRLATGQDSAPEALAPDQPATTAVLADQPSATAALEDEVPGTAVLVDTALILGLTEETSATTELPETTTAELPAGEALPAPSAPATPAPAASPARSKATKELVARLVKSGHGQTGGLKGASGTLSRRRGGALPTRADDSGSAAPSSPTR